MEINKPAWMINSHDVRKSTKEVRNIASRALLLNDYDVASLPIDQLR